MSRPFNFGGTMKENIKKIIAFIIATIILFVTMYSYGKVVKAEVPASQKVTSHSDSWGSYDFTYVFHSQYFKIQDATGIPGSTLLNPQYFYTDNNTSFKAISGGDLIMGILNGGIGVILDPDSVSYFINAFFDAIGPNHFDLTNSKYAQGGLYDSNDNFLGYCLNDISGCYYDGLTIIENVTVPDETVDNVKNFYEFQDDTHADYFTFYPFSNQYIFNNLRDSLAQTEYDYIQSHLPDDTLAYFDIITSEKKHVINNYADLSYYGIYYYVTNAEYLVFTTGAGTWNDFVDYFEITDDLLSSEMLFKFNANENHYIFTRAYDSNDNILSSGGTRINYRTQNEYNNQALSTITIGLVSNRIIIPFNKQLTVFKDETTKTALDSQTYYPSYYVTDSYNNYDQSNDNSFTLSMQSIDNSIQNNNNIYNDSNDSYYNYYDNGYYDTSSQVTNVTNIYNNYYNNSGGGDNPNNPDNPDNPDDPDSPVLDEILRAILRFFNAIGDIIGTILASILNLIDSVLEALAGVMEDMDGMSDFFSSLFAWLPDPVPQILGAGFGICLICGIIKFIRG